MDKYIPPNILYDWVRLLQDDEDQTQIQTQIQVQNQQQSSGVSSTTTAAATSALFRAKRRREDDVPSSDAVSAVVKKLRESSSSTPQSPQPSSFKFEENAAFAALDQYNNMTVREKQDQDTNDQNNVHVLDRKPGLKKEQQLLQQHQQYQKAGLLVGPPIALPAFQEKSYFPMYSSSLINSLQQVGNSESTTNSLSVLAILESRWNSAIRERQFEGQSSYLYN